MPSKASLPLWTAFGSKSTAQTPFLPFLYQTRTLRQPLRNRGLPSPSTARLFSLSTAPYSNSSRPYSHSEHGSARQSPNDRSDTDDHPPRPSRAPPSRESTITISEHQAFSRIFEDIIASSARPSSSSDLLQQPADAEPQADEKPATKKPSSRRGGAAAAAAEADDHSSFQPGESAHQQRQVNEDRLRQAIERYPPSLRAAARQAFGLMQQQQQHASTAALGETEALGSPDATTTAQAPNPLSEAQQSELRRIDRLLATAPTDIALWRVLETEVFAPITTLDPDRQQKNKPAAATSKPKGRKPKKSASTSTSTTSTTISDDDTATPPPPPATPNLSSLTLTYPTILLLSLRHLTTRFPSSPLPATLLATLKSHGPISYVLGATTPLYNTLLALRLHAGDRHGAAAADDLLRDMESGGIEFDEETLEILEEMAAPSVGVGGGDAGRAGGDAAAAAAAAAANADALQTIQNMEFWHRDQQKLNAWIPVVRARLVDRAVREARMGEFGVGDGDGEGEDVGEVEVAGGVAA
ncbi:MAG: hypothetical protein M1819_005767 [Sarea resinae]|nr:MAG: hypothetical protein M1819_005767 [Sarea resinae]